MFTFSAHIKPKIYLFDDYEMSKTKPSSHDLFNKAHKYTNPGQLSLKMSILK